MEAALWVLMSWCWWVFVGETFLEWRLGQRYLHWKVRRGFGTALLASTFWPLIYTWSRE